MKGYDKKFVVQGIHMLFNGEVCDEWEVEDNQRKSKLVFIGIDLPHQEIKEEFEKCVAEDKIETEITSSTKSSKQD
jgi:G3E family GTPase